VYPIPIDTYACFREKHIVHYVVWKHHRLHSIANYALANYDHTRRSEAYDRTKRVFPRCAFTYASRVLCELRSYRVHIAFVLRFFLHSCVWSDTSCRSMQNVILSTHIEFFLLHSIHAFLRGSFLRGRCDAALIQSSSIIISCFLTVRFRFGKSGRRKRKWRDGKRGHGSRTVQT